MTGFPTDGTIAAKFEWFISKIENCETRISALETAADQCPAPAPQGHVSASPVPEAEKEEISYPEWLPKQPNTKSKFKEYVRVMGRMPDHSELLGLAEQMEVGKLYKKKNAADLWNCSQTFAQGFLFFLQHLKKVEFSKSHWAYKRI